MEYAENVKARMVRRMLGPDAMTATSLAGETGISQATLSRWLAASIKGVSNSKPDAPTTETAERQLDLPADDNYIAPL